MRVLITGSEGLVGRHLVDHFVEDGATVIGIDDLSSRSAIEPKRQDHRFYKMDCRDYFRTVQGGKPFDYVFHCAAIVGGREHLENNQFDVATDLAIDASLFEWAVRARPHKIVYFSSSAVYPLAFQTKKDNRILTEDMVEFSYTAPFFTPDVTYGWSKLTGEFLAHQAHEKYGLNIAIYRPFSGYAEDQHDSYPFPAILNRIIRGDEVIDVYGSGTQKRDFIHIDDCIQGVIKTMDSLNGQAMNLSTGIGTSFDEFVALAGKVVGRELKINHLTDKPEGVHTRVGDTKKQLSLGFMYTVSLEEGITRYINAHT